MLDQRGIADRFLSAGQVMQGAGFALIPMDISDFPTRHNYVLALWQSHFEPILATWVGELGVPILRSCEVVGFAQDDTGVDVELSGDMSLRAEYLVGCDGGRSLIRKAAGIDFAGSDPTTSWMIAEVEMDEEPEFGIVATAPASMPSVGEQPGSPSGSCSRNDMSSTPATPAWASFARHSSPCTGRTAGFAAPIGSPGSPT